MLKRHCSKSWCNRFSTNLALLAQFVYTPFNACTRKLRVKVVTLNNLNDWFQCMNFSRFYLILQTNKKKLNKYSMGSHIMHQEINWGSILTSDFPSEASLLASFSASFTQAFKTGTGGVFSVSLKWKINLTAKICLPLSISFWITSARQTKISLYNLKAFCCHAY